MITLSKTTLSIDAHGLKVWGVGVLQVFAKTPGGIKAFRKNYQGSPLFWVLLQFYKQVFQKFSKRGPGGCLIPHPPPHCVHLWCHCKPTCLNPCSFTELRPPEANQKNLTWILLKRLITLSIITLRAFFCNTTFLNPCSFTELRPLEANKKSLLESCSSCFGFGRMALGLVSLHHVVGRKKHLKI